MKKVTTAFILGAGFGTRLKPLTNQCPKPLLRIGGRPIITYVFDHLIQTGIQRIIINTHHLHHIYDQTFPEREWKGIPLIFRHEHPEILDTGGGVRNIIDLVQEDENLIVYNGDIMTNLPIEKLLHHHFMKSSEVTLALRSKNGPLHVNTDENGQIVDIRHELKRPSARDCLFASIYVVQTSFLNRIPPNTKISVISTFLDMLRKKESINSLLIDEGHWSDIGTHDEFNRIQKAYEKQAPHDSK
ncbi:MAG: sugar phosphate nucleotidyltransferase [Verrucomicrobiota bacterium]